VQLTIIVIFRSLTIDCNNEISLPIIKRLYTYNCVFYHLCMTSTLWPEDGQVRPKHVVTIAAINTKPRQLCFWRTPLPSFNDYSILHLYFMTSVSHFLYLRRFISTFKHVIIVRTKYSVILKYFCDLKILQSSVHQCICWKSRSEAIKTVLLHARDDEKFINDCFVQLCTPWWWTNESPKHVGFEAL
jgi:hypothetical protein